MKSPVYNRDATAYTQHSTSVLLQKISAQTNKQIKENKKKASKEK